MLKSPIIGVVLDEQLSPSASGADFARRPFYALRKDYFDRLREAGGCPIGVPYISEALGQYLTMCDGWLLPGADYRFDLSWYERPPPAHALAASFRRDFEANLASRILASGAPVLGVCNGMQVMAAISGGKINYGVNPDSWITHKSNDGIVATHDVMITPDSIVGKIFRTGRITVNSSHKEIVTSVGTEAVVAAKADDGVIEAIEFPGLRFAIGVQWHPELFEGNQPNPLFEGLVDAAR